MGIPSNVAVAHYGAVTDRARDYDEGQESQDYDIEPGYSILDGQATLDLYFWPRLDSANEPTETIVRDINYGNVGQYTLGITFPDPYVPPPQIRLEIANSSVTAPQLGWAPVARDDFFALLGNGTLEIELGDLLENDLDYDDAPDPLDVARNGSGAPIVVDEPQHGTLDWNATLQKFIYTPTQNYLGEDHFSYRAFDGDWESNFAVALLNVKPRIDLIIYHGGQNGGAVDAAVEDTIGAFTVANLNDTDGDGRSDANDDQVKSFASTLAADALIGAQTLQLNSTEGFKVNDVVLLVGPQHSLNEDLRKQESVKITAIDGNQITLEAPTSKYDFATGATIRHTGRDEVDLMLLEVKAKSGDTVTISKVGNVAFYKDSTKTPFAGNDYQGGNLILEVPANGTLQFWAEATAASAMVGDIQITATIGASSDSVLATGVWASATQVFHDKTHKIPNSAIESGTVGERFEEFGGEFGPVAHQTGPRNVFMSEFKLVPANLPALVKFDLTRQAAMTFESREKSETNPNPNAWSNWNDRGSSFPIEAERANDDGEEDDQSEKPVNQLIYQIDAPGVREFDADRDDLRLIANFYDWVRIGIGNKPDGNDIQGSRASAKVMWHSYSTGKYDAILQRMVPTTDPSSEVNEKNEVGNGHVPIPDPEWITLP